MPVEVWVYEGIRPAPDSIRQQLGIQQDRLYLTATRAQADGREALAGAAQTSADGPVIHFPAAIQHLIARPILTRTELRVLVGRFADEEPDGRRRAQLHHDAGALVDAMNTVWETGIAPADLPMDLLASPDLQGLLTRLDRWLRERPEVVDRPPLAISARRLLSSDQPLAETVLLEGFTFLTPVQKYLLETQHRAGARVVVVAPYSEGQPRTFQAIRTTYDPWWDTRQQLRVDPHPASPLGELQERFDLSEPVVSLPQGVQIFSAHHRHAEAARAVEIVRDALAEGVPAREIAIVTPSRSEFDQLLLEEADRAALPVRLTVPPRLLLLTPVGRFVLTLYELWSEGEVRISAEQFHTLLVSGWLGARAQVGATAFQLVSDQWFAKCSTMQDWERACAGLRDLDRSSLHPRVPARWVTDRDLEAWSQSINLVATITSRLFGDVERPIGEHVQALLRELEQLESTHRFVVEQTVLDRIREVLQEATTAASLPVEAQEFGEVLVALAREYEGADDDQPHSDRIWVTTPNGLDGLRRQVVVGVGFDSSTMPRSFDPGWPLIAGDLAQHLRVERYMFGAVLRSAASSLHLSFSWSRDGQPVGPSVYLRLLGAQPPSALAARADAETGPDNDGRSRVVGREWYTLTELAIFGLCPYRYRAEQLGDRAAVLGDSFHLHLQAEADWFELALDALASGSVPSEKPVFERRAWAAARAAEATVRSLYPGLAEADWRVVKDAVRKQIAWLLETRVTDAYRAAVERLSPQSFDILRDGRVIEVRLGVRFGLRSGIVTFPQAGPESLRTFGFPEKRPASVSLKEHRWARVFQEPSAAQYFFRDTVSALYSNAAWAAAERERSRTLAAELIETVEDQHYPRRPGPHCLHCPILDPCLGLDAA